MGQVRNFIAELEKYEKTEVYKKFAKEGTLTCPENVKVAIGYIMTETKGRFCPTELKKLLLLEWNV